MCYYTRTLLLRRGNLAFSLSPLSYHSNYIRHILLLGRNSPTWARAACSLSFIDHT